MVKEGKGRGKETAGQDRERVLDEAVARIKEKKLADAESLLKSLLPEEIPSEEDSSSLTLSFQEPIEEIYYRFRFKPRKEIRKGPAFGSRLFLTYACVLMENKDFEEALRILGIGLKYNPVDAGLLFEEGEIFKMRGDWAVFKRITDLCLSFACRSADIARAYRNYGYLFLEQGDYDGAASCYLLSREYEDHLIARKQLERISRLMGREIDESFYHRHFRDILEERKIQIGPSRDLLNIAFTFAENCERDGDYRAACYFYGVLFDLTRDAGMEEKIKDLTKRIEEVRH